jgi:hypothetical protein
MTESRGKPELQVQMAAIKWLTENCGYNEVLSGVKDGTRNAAMDSIGLMYERAFLIEFKTYVQGSMIRNNLCIPNTVKRKIARTLAGVASVNGV